MIPNEMIEKYKQLKREKYNLDIKIREMESKYPYLKDIDCTEDLWVDRMTKGVIND